MFGFIKRAARAWVARNLDYETRQMIAARTFEAMNKQDRQNLARAHFEPKQMLAIIPDREVAHIGLPFHAARLLDTDIFLNRSGLRSRKDFTPKSDDVFRIVCLGDSYVFGHGVEEQDRFGDQLQAFYAEQDITIDGKRIEILSIGFSGWSLVQEAAYLTRRFSEYQPDLVILTTLSNDITTNAPGDLSGHKPNRFSPEEYEWGSGFFAHDVNYVFGDRGAGAAMQNCDSPTIDRYWDKAMAGLKRLEALLHDSGGRMLISVVNPRDMVPNPFAIRFIDKANQAGIQSPKQIVTFLASDETMVPADGHPNRKGHELIMRQYLAALHELGWIEVGDSLTPPLEPEISLQLDAPLDRSRHDAYLSRYCEAHILSDIDFTNFTEADTRAFIGGILPFNADHSEQTEHPPWASIRAGLLMRRPNAKAFTIDIDIDIPARRELFPLRIRLEIDAIAAATFNFETLASAGSQRLHAILPEAAGPEIVEVVLFADQHFSTLETHQMQSYQLKRIRIS